MPDRALRIPDASSFPRNRRDVARDALKRRGQPRRLNCGCRGWGAGRAGYGWRSASRYQAWRLGAACAMGSRPHLSELDQPTNRSGYGAHMYESRIYTWEDVASSVEPPLRTCRPCGNVERNLHYRCTTCGRDYA